MVHKMIEAFQKAEGGLFATVAKADVGDATAQMQKNGVTLMSWADPFYPDPSIPKPVIKATVAAIENGSASHYTAPIGSAALKEEIAKRMLRVDGLQVDAQRNILITPGSDSGLYYAMLPFVQQGDEVMIVDPSYPNNVQNTEIMGGRVVPVPVYAANGYQLDVAEFEKRVTGKTKMVVLTNPNNPTTTVYRRECLEALARFIVCHDLVCVVDEAFAEPVFDGLEMVMMASLPGMWERTLTVRSLSKGMGLSGFRVGYVVADDRIMDKLYGAAVSVLGATNTAAQIGAIAALQNDDFMEDYARIHAARRDMVYTLLHDIPGVRMMKSESGFLSWLDVSLLGGSEEVVAYLLANAKVSINVGTPYGQQGTGHVRIVHGVLGSEDDFQAAIRRIRGALTALAKEKAVG